MSLLLVALPLAAAQEPGPEVPRWEMRADAGNPVNPDCAPDNDFEVAGPQGDGTMFFPNEGCTVAYGHEATNGSMPLSIYYKVTGHVGEICGHFSFSGAWVGQSAPTCTAHDAVTRMPVHVVPGNGTEMAVTWHPTTWEHDNAYVCSFTMAGEPPVPLAESTDCFAPAQIPFFPSVAALMLALLGVVAGAAILVRRK